MIKFVVDKLMDKSWINLKARTSEAYGNGVREFLDLAFQKASVHGRIMCPCRKCINAFWRTRTDVIEHIVLNGFQKNYIQWTYHGENSSSLDSNGSVNEAEYDMIFEHDINGLLSDAFGGVNMDTEDVNSVGDVMSFENSISNASS